MVSILHVWFVATYVCIMAVYRILTEVGVRGESVQSIYGSTCITIYYTEVSIVYIYIHMYIK